MAGYFEKFTSTDTSNCYMIATGEANGYDDSDWFTVLYDANDHKLKIHYGTTRGVYEGCEPRTPIAKATDEIRAEAIKAMIDFAESMLVKDAPQTITADCLECREYNMPCVVNGGRKWNGNGVLKEVYRRSFTPIFARGWKNRDRYTNVTIHAVIETENGAKETVAAKYCKVDVPRNYREIAEKHYQDIVGDYGWRSISHFSKDKSVVDYLM